MTVTGLRAAESSTTATRPDGRGAAGPVSMIERMTLILDAFDAATPTLSLLDITTRTGLPRSTVHRILDQMIRLRWLAHTVGGYRLGLRALELGGVAAGHNEIRDAAAPLLHDLAQRTGLVAHLAVLDGREVVYLDKTAGRTAPPVPTRLGGRLPAHATAVGKAMLAGLEPPIAEAALRARLPRLTNRTLWEPDTLQREFTQIRLRQGIAVDREESMPGIACVAAPVRNRGLAPAALSLTGRADAMSFDRLARFVLDAAREITRTLAPATRVTGTGH
ncbi:IclR family transcriptional regulator [Nocardia stercoris]|uniref:IclR family transcriptional regulator n=1 Tax=Nocardia stercoris TaxID=2483361 RepID=A0A3M2L8K8_9NOCA|nr:IclR family transcriptional regulator [Nocardia stercoris]RMI32853.1 IclR family transcriptional regulator [Nocardia stercoris]